MLKRFFIAMLGSLAAIWISFMLFMILGMVMVIGSIASALTGSTTVKSVSDNTVMVIDLDTQITERNDTKNDIYAILNRQTPPMALNDLIAAIKAAKDDDKIEGIYLKCEGSTAGSATRYEILRALEDFKSSGKWIAAYADSYTQGDYYIASCADHLIVNPVGAVDLHGIGSMVPFFKGLLDKVGVEMQIIKVGTYKSAVEPYILTSMSEPSREQTSVYINAIWDNVAGSICKNRGITREQLLTITDSVAMTLSAKELKDLKIVTDIKYRHEVKDLLKKLLSVDDDDDINSISWSDYLSVADIANRKENKHKIAVYYAFGDIVDSGNEGIVSSRMVPDILDLAEQDDIEGMVLRVNSPGGSAFASEQIWEALQTFKGKGKKLYVSMGDYAASGGYYISCGADRIFAEPVTLTGSIGIFGMMPCVKELVTDKLGVTFSTVTTNSNAIFPTILEPMTPLQRRRMQVEINRGYDLFTSRCAEGRHMTQDSIKVIGEGRVWDGMTALKIGLVDEIGGTADAVKALAKDLDLFKYQVVEYPNADKSFWEMISNADRYMKANAMKEELGPVYPVYRQVKQLSEMSPVQARMETVIID